MSNDRRVTSEGGNCFRSMTIRMNLSFMNEADSYNGPGGLIIKGAVLIYDFLPALPGSDYEDNDTGRGCSSTCDQCEDCCAMEGIPINTPEGTIERPYGPYCQGRYKDQMGNVIVE